MIPEDKVAEIRDRTDLYALVKEYVPLKRSGTSYKGLCPFHGEKTPSFYVHPERGFYKCFGCQASGDAITFFMRIEGHPFPEALRILAERAGVKVEVVDAATDRAAQQARAHRERLVSLVDAAAGFFVKSLGEHRLASMAWAELSRRSIGEDAVARFRLGYAPHGWDELSSFLAQRGFSPVDCEQVGLVIPRRAGGGHYDRFRHRLMFPISDPHGRIVAFSGRALESLPTDRSDEPPAKYVNSPEGPLYHKSDLLFGLHEARVELRRADCAILCEGNFDVVALSQAGFTNVVAPLGTAFTAAQAKLLRRYVSSVVLLFDADSAGRKAVRAAQPLLAEAGLAGRVVTLPEKEDPDSFLRTRGAEAMQRLIDAAPGIIEHLIESAAFDAGADARAKAEAIEALGPVLASVDNPVEKRVYVERVARAFELRDLRAVDEQLRRATRPVREPRRTSPAGPREPVPARAVEPFTPPELEQQVVSAFLDQPSLHASGLGEKMHGLLTSADLRAILSLTQRWAGARGIDATAMLGDLGESPARDWLERRLALQVFEDEASARSFVERAILLMDEQRLERERKRLRREFQEAKRVGDHERADALWRRISEVHRGSPRRGTMGTKR